MKDMVNKKRSLIGTSNPCAKLTENQVLAIRKNTTSSHAELARQYKVDPALIRRIRLREIWKHI